MGLHLVGKTFVLHCIPIFGSVIPTVLNLYFPRIQRLPLPFDSGWHLTEEVLNKYTRFFFGDKTLRTTRTKKQWTSTNVRSNYEYTNSGKTVESRDSADYGKTRSVDQYLNSLKSLSFRICNRSNCKELVTQPQRHDPPPTMTINRGRPVPTVIEHNTLCHGMVFTRTSVMVKYYVPFFAIRRRH